MEVNVNIIVNTNIIVNINIIANININANLNVKSKAHLQPASPGVQTPGANGGLSPKSETLFVLFPFNLHLNYI